MTTRADLALAKTADAATYKPNTTVTYRLVAPNNGSSDAQNVVIVDDLPDIKQAEYLSNTGGCVFQAPKTLTCSLGTMAAGSTREFSVTMKVKGAKGEVVNSATVSSSTADPVPANNTASVRIACWSSRFERSR